MIEIRGASDDLVEVEGCKGAGEYACRMSDLLVWRGDLIAPSGDQMRIYGIFDGCWHFSKDGR